MKLLHTSHAYWFFFYSHQMFVSKQNIKHHITNFPLSAGKPSHLFIVLAGTRRHFRSTSVTPSAPSTPPKTHSPHHLFVYFHLRPFASIWQTAATIPRIMNDSSPLEITDDTPCVYGARKHGEFPPPLCQVADGAGSVRGRLVLCEWSSTANAQHGGDGGVVAIA